MNRISALLFLCIAASAVSGPAVVQAFDKSLIRTGPVEAGNVKGSFTVILYGSRHANDIETVALLDIEGDEYTIEPYAPDFDYRVKKRLSAKDALHDAETFVGWHHAFWKTEMSRIFDTKGNTVGYEVRPFYRPLFVGFSDVMDIVYSLKGSTVRAHIHLKPEVERRLQGGDSRDQGK